MSKPKKPTYEELEAKLLLTTNELMNTQHELQRLRYQARTLANIISTFGAIPEEE